MRKLSGGEWRTVVSDVTFEELNIPSAVLKAVEGMGFTKPTEIQQQAIPILMNSDKDFIGQAQTGTGKTAAFVIPLLDKIDFSKNSVQALVLAPTRELAVQVENEVKKLAQYTDARSTCIYGGASYEKQLNSLKKDKPHIVVGTPGRIIDLVKKRVLSFDQASFCILDEADEMLNMGFFEDVKKILGLFPEDRRLVMFSATMPKQIISLVKSSFRDYKMVQVERKSLTNDDIEQKYFIVNDKHRKESLARLIDIEPDIYAIVFCRTRIETREVGEDLISRGHNIEVLNGDMGQLDRERAMKRFKSKKANLLVCTDVAARGIDVNNLTHVFNFGLPQDNESYIHRIGRTGRAGMKGKAFTIVSPKMVFAIRKIERHMNGKIQLAKLPTVNQLKNSVVSKEIEKAQHYINIVSEKGSEFKTDPTFDLFKSRFADLEIDDLLKVIFAWKFDNSLRSYNKLTEIEATAHVGGGDSKSAKNRGRNGRSRSPRGRGPGGSGGGSGRKPKPHRGSQQRTSRTR